jgi:hypothetical protein
MEFPPIDRPNSRVLSSAELEDRIRERMGVEEHRRVSYAMSQSVLEHAESIERRIGRAVAQAAAAERERWIRVCEQFPDNMMAQHIRKLGTGGL